MLLIRPEQMKVFSALQSERLDVKLRSYLESNYPDQVKQLPPGGLEAFLKRGHTKASALGFLIEADHARWIELMLIYGEDFGTTEKYPWAKEILEDRLAIPSEHLSRIDAWLRLDALYKQRLAGAQHGV